MYKKLRAEYKDDILKICLRHGDKARHVIAKKYSVCPMTAKKFQKRYFWRYTPPGKKKSYGRDYEVYADGRVWSHRRFTFLRPTLNSKTGYYMVTLNRVRMSLHGVLMRLFKRQPRPGEQVRHLNGIRTDNRLKNLRWGTCKQNAADKIGHGRQIMGDSHPGTKIPERHVIILRRRHAAGEKNLAIRYAKRYGVSSVAVRNALNHRTFKHVTAT